MTSRMLPWSAANRANVRANSGLPRKLICSVAVLAGGNIPSWVTPDRAASAAVRWFLRQSDGPVRRRSGGPPGFDAS